MARRSDPPPRKAGRRSRAGKDSSLAAVRQRSPLTPFYVIIGLVALAGIGVLLYVLRGGETPALEAVPVMLDAEELARVPGIAIGPEDAPVVMYEFADFQCPACAHYATFVLPLVKERLVQQGTVRYVYYDFPLRHHQHAFLASRAGRCANEQGHFWEYHDVLYARQPRWSAVRDATPLFVEYAGEVAGLDRRAFESCLRSDRYAEEVSQNMQLGESLGVAGTPTLFVNGRRLPQIPGYSGLEQIILEEAGTSPAAGATPATEPDMTGPEPPSGE